MLPINQWLENFQEKVLAAFPGRILFLGLQGRYAREEATETSDIDVVVIFDALFSPAKKNLSTGKNPTCSNFTTIPFHAMAVWIFFCP